MMVDKKAIKDVSRTLQGVAKDFADSNSLVLFNDHGQSTKTSAKQGKVYEMDLHRKRLARLFENFKASIEEES